MHTLHVGELERAARSTHSSAAAVPCLSGGGFNEPAPDRFNLQCSRANLGIKLVVAGVMCKQSGLLVQK